MCPGSLKYEIMNYNKARQRKTEEDSEREGERAFIVTERSDAAKAKRRRVVIIVIAHKISFYLKKSTTGRARAGSADGVTP